MNKVILVGRLTKDPESRTSGSGTVVTRYTLAVDRGGKRNADEQNADFIGCVTFNKGAEFAQKYLKKGTKILVEGAIRTGKYVNKDGVTVYTTDVVVERHEFCEKRPTTENGTPVPAAPATPIVGSPNDGFISIPDDEILPFN